MKQPSSFLLAVAMFMINTIVLEVEDVESAVNLLVHILFYFLAFKTGPPDSVGAPILVSTTFSLRLLPIIVANKRTKKTPIVLYNDV